MIDTILLDKINKDKSGFISTYGTDITSINELIANDNLIFDDDSDFTTEDIDQIIFSIKYGFPLYICSFVDNKCKTHIVTGGRYIKAVNSLLGEDINYFPYLFRRKLQIFKFIDIRIDYLTPEDEKKEMVNNLIRMFI